MHQLDNMEIDYDIDIPIVVENTFSVLKHHSYIRGYHAYRNIWTPIIGDDNLLCKQERDNKHDENAIAVLKSAMVRDLVLLGMFPSATLLYL